MSKILLVEDEKDIREGFARLFTRKGHTVFTAETGPEGIKAFEKENPDIVFLDLHLPELHGGAVLKAIREIDMIAKVYIISGSAIEIEKMKESNAPVSGYLLKPISVDALFELIK